MATFFQLSRYAVIVSAVYASAEVHSSAQAGGQRQSNAMNDVWRMGKRNLTMSLSGRPKAPKQRRGRTLSSGARGAKAEAHHGPLQRLLDFECLLLLNIDIAHLELKTCAA